MAVFQMDGISYRVAVISLTRSASILDGDNAGRKAKSGRMWRDIIGTYYNYNLELDVQNMAVAEYDRLYEALTAPVDSHVLTVPYGQGTLTFDAYIANAEDTLIRMTERANLWGGLTVKFVAMKPYRTP